MDNIWHTSDGLFAASCVSVAMGLVGSIGSRCFDFADFALERC